MSVYVMAERKAPKDCALSESDYIGLSYMLAMHLPEKADKIIATQLSRIQNPDRKKEYQFISPSVSPRRRNVTVSSLPCCRRES